MTSQKLQMQYCETQKKMIELETVSETLKFSIDVLNLKFDQNLDEEKNNELKTIGETLRSKFQEIKALKDFNENLMNRNEELFMAVEEEKWRNKDLKRQVEIAEKEIVKFRETKAEEDFKKMEKLRSLRQNVIETLEQKEKKIQALEEVIRRIKPELVGSCEPAEVSNSIENVQLMNMVESMANEMINCLPSASD